MIPCGISFWNEPEATSYGRDPGATAGDNSERGVEFELDGSINLPPIWTAEANDGDTTDQVYVGQTERVVFCVISEQRITGTYPRVFFNSPSIGNQSTTISIDNNYTGPGWRYYAVEYIDCSGTSLGQKVSEPTNDYNYYYLFEYGIEFIPTFFQLNRNGIETTGSTNSSEFFDSPNSNLCLILPIKLVNFEGSYNINQINLNWNTQSELNFSGFELERSFDGIEFNEIAWVSAKGNNTNGRTYKYQDHNIQNSGKYLYYRLKEVDNDGTFNYSKTIVIELPQTKSPFQIFPNPATTNIQILASDLNPHQHLNLEVYNSLGQKVKELSNINSNNNAIINVNIDQLQVGFYSLHFLIDDIAIQNIRFIKQ